MNRRQFLQRSAIIGACVTVLPSLLPCCQECGDRLLVELLAGDTELCSACRASRPVVVQGWSEPLTYIDRPFAGVSELSELFKRTHDNMLIAVKAVQQDYRWLFAPA